MRKYQKIKDIYLAIRGEHTSVKWLKIRAGEGFIFHSTATATYTFW